MGKSAEVRVIFSGLSADRQKALIVGISRLGVHVIEVTDVRACSENPPAARYLATKAVFSWREFRNRDRCYSGDDGSGCLRQHIVAGAISLIAYHGGDHEWHATLWNVRLDHLG